MLNEPQQMKPANDNDPTPVAEYWWNGRLICPVTPVRLKTAAELAFPDGSMTVSGLRKEAKRGRLVIERIAGKDYTTLRNIELMRKLCRVDQKDPISGGERNVAPAAKSSARGLGSSSTTGSNTPRDALLARLEKRKSA
jgi:hypothetical protein